MAHSIKRLRLCLLDLRHCLRHADGCSSLGTDRRWCSAVDFIGPIGFQPSEFAKLATCIIVARFFATHKSELPYRIRDLLPILTLVGLIFSLIFLQPDFGTAGVCLLIALSQMAFVRIELRSIAIVLISSPLVAAIGWHALLRPYQKLRILNLLNPNLDPQNTGYNSLQSLIAVGSGNLFGKGYMQGTQAQLKFIPGVILTLCFLFSPRSMVSGRNRCVGLFAILPISLRYR